MRRRGNRRVARRRPARTERPQRSAPARRARRTGAAAAPRLGSLDGGILGSVSLLAALGVVMIYSTTAPLAMGSAVPPHFLRHLLGLVLALAAVGVGLGLPLRFWQRWALPLWGASVLLLVATLAVGLEANGARRWIAVPGLGVSVQASELARFATPVAVAALLVGARIDSARVLRSALLLAAVPTALLLLQPDLGSAALLLALVGALLFAAGTPLRSLALVGGAGVALVGVYVALKPYALARWRGFLEPWETARAEGFQLVQSFVAFGRGGSFGVGLGDGRQKLAYLPEAHTDFILSVVAEELGLVGVLVVLGAFAALAVAGLRVARRAEDPFARLLAFAMTGFLALPGAVNAGVVMGLLPTTGFTLPFVSFGTNSLVVCALAVGVLLRIAAREGDPTPTARVARRRS